MPILLVTAILCAALIILALLPAIGWLLMNRRVPPSGADVALVFGASTMWKAISRCETAADIFKRGLVRCLIVSGGVRMRETGMTEAEWLRNRLMESGVPGHLILLENRATNTRENAEFALPLIEDGRFSTVVLVMSDFEGLRAHLTAKGAWKGLSIAIHDYHATSSGHWNWMLWWLRPEGWGLTWYSVSRIIRYGLWRNI